MTFLNHGQTPAAMNSFFWVVELIVLAETQVKILELHEFAIKMRQRQSALFIIICNIQFLFLFFSFFQFLLFCFDWFIFSLNFFFVFFILFLYNSILKDYSGLNFNWKVRYEIWISHFWIFFFFSHYFSILFLSPLFVIFIIYGEKNFARFEKLKKK